MAYSRCGRLAGRLAVPFAAVSEGSGRSLETNVVDDEEVEVYGEEERWRG